MLTESVYDLSFPIKIYSFKLEYSNQRLPVILFDYFKVCFKVIHVFFSCLQASQISSILFQIKSSPQVLEEALEQVAKVSMCMYQMICEGRAVASSFLLFVDLFQRFVSNYQNNASKKFPTKSNGTVSEILPLKMLSC